MSAELHKVVDGEILPLTEEEIADYNQRIADAEAQAGERLKAEILAATQRRLDDFARSRNYDGIMSACTYVASTNPTFATEGTYCLQARDQTWSKLYEMLAEVEGGERPIPSGYDEIAGELPALEWPEVPA